MTVRNIPDEIYQGLLIQAAMHGQSAEAEMRNKRPAVLVSFD